MQRALGLGLEHVLVGRAVARMRRNPFRHRVARNAAEHRRIGDAVAAQSIGAVHAACILAGDE